MKCFEVTNCSEQERATCFVWNSFREHPQDMEDLKCWVLKGAYHAESGEQLKKCHGCKYYLMMNHDHGLVSDYDADIAVVSCDGTINNDRAWALEKVWKNLRQSNKTKILLDISKVNNIYSCGIGVLVKMHKEAMESGGLVVLVGAHGYVESILIATKLSRILPQAADRQQAAAIFEELRKKHEEAERAAEEAARPKPKKRIPCWEYWNNHNPGNATLCDECFRKMNPTNEPCWIVEGMIEGVSFQYVNESCEGCAYFAEFGGTPVHMPDAKGQA